MATTIAPPLVLLRNRVNSVVLQVPDWTNTFIGTGDFALWLVDEYGATLKVPPFLTSTVDKTVTFSLPVTFSLQGGGIAELVVYPNTSFRSTAFLMPFTSVETT